ncbi:hypothetical protein D3C74_426820 [compost metagenome]
MNAVPDGFWHQWPRTVRPAITTAAPGRVLWQKPRVDADHQTTDVDSAVRNLLTRSVQQVP